MSLLEIDQVAEELGTTADELEALSALIAGGTTSRQGQACELAPRERRGLAAIVRRLSGQLRESERRLRGTLPSA